MYEVFDRFLATGTWYTAHPLDQQRFFMALNLIVRDPAFSAAAMADYFRRKTATAAQQNPFEPFIQDFEAIADHVRGFLSAIDEI